MQLGGAALLNEVRAGLAAAVAAGARGPVGD